MRTSWILFTCGLLLSLPSVGQAPEATAEPPAQEADELLGWLARGVLNRNDRQPI